MKFEIIRGTHSNRNGHFKQGDVIDSDTDLTAVYKEKFRRRHDIEGTREGETEAPQRLATRGRTTTARTINLAPINPHANEPVHADHPDAKAVQQTEQDRLEAKAVDAELIRDNTRGRAAEVTRRALARSDDEDDTPPSAKRDEDDTKPRAAKEEGDTSIGSKFGTNATREFPELKGEDFSVFKNDKGHYNVVDKNNPNEAINEKPFSNRSEVSKLIKKLTD